MENQSTIALPALRLFAPDSLVCVCTNGDGVDYLRDQLERDITAKGLGWRPICFTLFELLEIEKLLPNELLNVVMTHTERMLVAQYCAVYHQQAREWENDKLTRLYDDLLGDLLENATRITFQL